MCLNFLLHNPGNFWTQQHREMSILFTVHSVLGFVQVCICVCNPSGCREAKGREENTSSAQQGEPALRWRVLGWVGGRVRAELLADLGGPLTLPLHENKGDYSRMLHWNLRVNSWALHKYMQQINTKLLFSHCGHQGTGLTTASLITPSTYAPFDFQGVFNTWLKLDWFVCVSLVSFNIRVL